MIIWGSVEEVEEKRTAASFPVQKQSKELAKGDSSIHLMHKAPVLPTG